MEVGLDGQVLNHVAERVGHDAAHPRKLRDLAARAARIGVGEHEDRVGRLDGLEDRLADVFRRSLPLFQHALFALAAA